MSMGARLVLFPRFDPDMVLAATTRHPARSAAPARWSAPRRPCRGGRRSSARIGSTAIAPSRRIA
ncbi:hypothetical protein CJ026_026675 [Ralstonia pickettii]|nr:hypothetical protein CJ026_026675 [Ralstonia pickettii]